MTDQENSDRDGGSQESVEQPLLLLLKRELTSCYSNNKRSTEELDFYTGDLGLRLVKLTVNQDDHTVYHPYYGDELGRPGIF